jgi:amino acid adenylation domain-containing protein
MQPEASRCSRILHTINTAQEIEPIKAIVDSSFVDRLAVDRNVPPASAMDVARVCPTSFSQRALWVLDQILPDHSVYNEFDVFRVEGALDIEALTQALNESVRRHEALRTSFRLEDGEPVQVVAAELRIPLEVTDLTSLPEDEREVEGQRRARDEARMPFDLEHGPLIRVRLLRLAKDEHWLLITAHHLIRDGSSMVVFAEELSQLYGARRLGGPLQLGEQPGQYPDYAAWQQIRLQGEFLEEQLSYWKQALADLPALDLPTDRPRPSAASYRGARWTFALGEGLTGKLKELRRREHTTLFTTLLAGLQVLLYRYTGQEDIAVGVPVAGRVQPEFARSIGYFTNVLVLRGDLSGEPSFSEYLARVRARTVAAYAHQELPFAKLIEELAPKRDASRNPLFQVSLVKGTEQGETPKLAGLGVERIEASGTETAKFDLAFSVAEHDGKIDVVIEYATDLFDAATVERMAGHWQVLLEGIVADPHRSISQLPLLTEAERQQFLQWDATATEYPRDRCLHELFEAQVQRTPQAVAVLFEDERLTYAELNARANRLAHHLRTLGVGPEVLVAIAMERSLELLVGLLGILKAGGAYVPLDPTYPPERLAFMLSDTQAPVLLTQERLRGRLPTHAARTLYLDSDQHIAQQPDTNPTRSASPDNLAYVMYTSGSTGQPKGVMVEHRSVVNYIAWIGRAFPLDVGDRVLQKTPISFDASVEEIFFPLASGVPLVIAGSYVHRSVAEMLATVREAKITVLQVVPSLLMGLLDHGDFRSCESLRLILCGADVMSCDLARRLSEKSRAELVNLYGPTETTISSTFWKFNTESPGATVPVGIPIANTQAMVVDRAGQPLPVGVPGELWIGGAGVARGYLNRPDLTSERFAAEPFSSDLKGRVYKTGDRVRRLADGRLDFLGRDDRQVKIHGFRIELGEVEGALRQHEALQDAVVLVREDRTGDKRLVAYAVPAAGRSLFARDLRRFLLGRLPDYMVPVSFEFLEAMPLGASGKIDRAALAGMPVSEPATHERVDPRNAVEVQLMRIWERILDVSHIGMQDNFFALGGDSLAAVRVVERIEQLFGRELPPDILWYEEGTIESLARALLDHSGPPVWSGPVAMKASGKRRPLFCPHIVGGHLFFYDNLARHLHEDQPLYGLPARGFDGRTPPDSCLEAMAAHCIGNMRHVQPKGPYLLAGYCSGALIAFEMARQLQAQGETVDLLALCDSLAPGFHPLELVQTVWNFLRLRNVRIVQQRLYRFILQNLGLGHLRKFRTVTEAHFWALLSYRPKPYSGHVVLIRASNMDDSRSRSLGWEKFARNGVDVCMIPAGHGAMVREPLVRVLAEKLETYLRPVAQEPRSHESRPVVLDPNPALGL